MITGQAPFKGDYDKAVMYSILNEEPAPLTSLRTGVPVKLEVLVGKALAKNADERYQSTGEIALDLKTLCKKLESGRTVVVSKASGEPSPPAKPVLGDLVSKRKLQVAWLLFAVAALIAVGVSALYFTAPGPSDGPAWTITPLTTYRGTERDPAISPDGEQIAFIWEGEKGDNPDVYVRLVDGGRPLPLTTDPATESDLTWSPDGKRIAFIREKGIFTLPALGGQERQVARLENPLNASRTSSSGLSWSPDGRFIAVGTLEGIRSIDTESGESHPLTEVSPPTFDRFPRFSPDGTSIAFYRGSSIFSGAAYILSLSDDGLVSGEPSRITEPAWRSDGLAWLDEGRTLVLSARIGSRFLLWRLPSSGTSPRLLPVDSDGVLSTVGVDSNPPFGLSERQQGGEYLAVRGPGPKWSPGGKLRSPT